MHSSAYDNAAPTSPPAQQGRGGAAASARTSSTSGGERSSTTKAQPPDADSCAGGVDAATAAVATLVIEARVPDGRAEHGTAPAPAASLRGYAEGPHCPGSKASLSHVCDQILPLCRQYELIRSRASSCRRYLRVDVLLASDCECGRAQAAQTHQHTAAGEAQSYAPLPTASATAANASAAAAATTSSATAHQPPPHPVLLERWHLTVHKATSSSSAAASADNNTASSQNTSPVLLFNKHQLINAVRSQLHFSQLAAWLSSSTHRSQVSNIIYRLSETSISLEDSRQEFKIVPNEHAFPTTTVDQDNKLDVVMQTLPRLEKIIELNCAKCHTKGAISKPKDAVKKSKLHKLNPASYYTQLVDDKKALASQVVECYSCDAVFDDRMHSACTKSGKHKCTLEDEEDDAEKYLPVKSEMKKRRGSEDMSKCNIWNEVPSTSQVSVVNMSSNIHSSGYHEHDLINYCDTSVKNSKTKTFCDKGTQTSDLDYFSAREFKEILMCLNSQKKVKVNKNDLGNKQSKSEILLEAILKCSKTKSNNNCISGDKGSQCEPSYKCDISDDDESKCDISLDDSDNKVNNYSYNVKSNFIYKCDKKDSVAGMKEKRSEKKSICISPLLIENRKELYKNSSCLGTKRRIDFNDSQSILKRTLLNATMKSDSVFNTDTQNGDVITEDREIEEAEDEYSTYVSNGLIPSAQDQQRFRRSLDNAASMVFHSRTGLPLTSSPAPMRKGSKSFDYDSNINSVSAIRSALFELPPCPADDDSESDCSAVSPCSPDVTPVFPLPVRPSVQKYARPASSLLGSFEESVLNGRLEPVSTVHGFTTEIGASGSFCPSHKKLPVTVFFYTLGDMDKVSAPYLGHINLGKKGYCVPRNGTVQVTLFNPLGTVVKMFVVMYDLTDMPANTHTFVRQRTVYGKQLRYLIHLRFGSSKSGRIRLHTDIRMIVCRRADMDTAAAIADAGLELRSTVHYPSNPRYSPRK